MSREGHSASAQAMARRLLERDVKNELDVDALGVAMQRAVDRVVRDLTGVVGRDGLDALLDRAIDRARREHPAVERMRRDDGAGVPLDVAAAIETHGADAARAGLEAVLAALVDILTALIGADMTRNLLHGNDS